ncbi:hypothetical protein ACWGJB_32905 [Streptomyces sp. NPDC054813]
MVNDASRDPERTGGARVLPVLIRVRAYSLLTGGFFAFWAWCGLVALTVLLLPGAQWLGTALVAGWALSWLTVLPATYLWHAPELLGRPLGPWPEHVGGFTGHLVRNADKGTFDGSRPLVLGGSAPPEQFWFVACLNTVETGFILLSAFLGDAAIPQENIASVVLVGLGFLASALSLTLLVHGSVTRRRSRRKATPTP